MKVQSKIFLFVCLFASQANGMHKVLKTIGKVSRKSVIAKRICNHNFRCFSGDSWPMSEVPWTGIPEQSKKTTKKVVKCPVETFCSKEFTIRGGSQKNFDELNENDGEVKGI